MRPIRTGESNFTYVIPGVEGSDLPCFKSVDGRTVSVWEPTPDERARIARGENIMLHVWMQPPPPVALTVEPRREVFAEALETKPWPESRRLEVAPVEQTRPPRLGAENA